MKSTREQLEIRAAAAAAALTMQNPQIQELLPIPCDDNEKIWDFTKTYEHYFDYVMKRLENND